MVDRVQTMEIVVDLLSILAGYSYLREEVFTTINAL